MYACRLCKKLNNSNLVQPGGVDCFPSWIMDYIHLPQYRHGSWNKDCLELKSPSYLSGKSRARMYKMPSKDRRHGNNTYWMMMAFESVRRLCLLLFVYLTLCLQGTFCKRPIYWNYIQSMVTTWNTLSWK